MSDSTTQSDNEQVSAVATNLFSNKVYTILKWIVVLAMPALATLYATLASVWGWGYGTQVVLTINALTLFLGILLGISTKTYSGDGTLVVDPDDNQNMRLVLDATPEELAAKKAITFAVTNK